MGRNQAINLTTLRCLLRGFRDSLRRHRRRLIAQTEYSSPPLSKKHAASLLSLGLFDADWYSSCYGDVKLSGLPPLEHYLERGHRLGRAPGPSFDPHWYAAANSKTISRGTDPTIHFLEEGYQKGFSSVRPSIDLRNVTTSLSVVAPTFNRSSLLPALVESIYKGADGLDFEIIVVDDGSTDSTCAVLSQLATKYPRLISASQKKHSAGKARNYGASLASKDIILFIGDDILPATPHFFLPHLQYHQAVACLEFAVLGKIEWPGNYDFEITQVMRHIQGPGGEQFAYADMAPSRAFDWRNFYTSNVSVKRKLVADWNTGGFSPAFRAYGFEDAEFAYRMQKQKGAFPVFYAEESVGHHYHRHDAGTFLRRQWSAGAMAKVFCDAHPEAESFIGGISEIKAALESKTAMNLNSIVENLQLAERLQSWPKRLESQNRLGTNNWHKELLHRAFQLAFSLGYLHSACRPTENYALGLQWVISEATSRLNTVLHKDKWESFGF